MFLFDEETSNATTTFSCSGTTTSPTPPTNSADISVPTNSIPQYQEKPGPTTQLSEAEPLIYFKHLWTVTQVTKY